MKILQIDHLSYKDEDKSILSDISFDVHKGDCISIIGESGSGKSTLLKLCADLIEITEGSMRYKGKDYKTYEPIELRRNVSYCIQMPCLFGDTVYDNLEFPFKIRHQKVDEPRLIELLQAFNLGIDYLHKPINDLSGGEKQRIAFIRNIIFVPEVLLLDEVTAALDTTNAQVIENYIKELNEAGVTVLWVTHNLKQSERIFNKRIVIANGQLERMEELN